MENDSLIFQQMGRIHDTLSEVSQHTRPKHSLTDMLDVVDGRVSILAMAMGVVAAVAGVLAAVYAYKGYIYQRQSARSLEESNNRHPSLWPLVKKVYDNYVPLLILFERGKDWQSIIDVSQESRRGEDLYFYNRYPARVMLCNMRLPMGKTLPEKYEIYGMPELYDKVSETHELIVEYNNYLAEASEIMLADKPLPHSSYVVPPEASLFAADGERVRLRVLGKNLMEISSRIIANVFDIEYYVDVCVNKLYEKEVASVKRAERRQRAIRSVQRLLPRWIGRSLEGEVARLANGADITKRTLRKVRTESCISLSEYIVSRISATTAALPSEEFADPAMTITYALTNLGPVSMADLLSSIDDYRESSLDKHSKWLEQSKWTGLEERLITSLVDIMMRWQRKGAVSVLETNMSVLLSTMDMNRFAKSVGTGCDAEGKPAANGIGVRDNEVVERGQKLCTLTDEEREKMKIATDAERESVKKALEARRIKADAEIREYARRLVFNLEVLAYCDTKMTINTVRTSMLDGHRPIDYEKRRIKAKQRHHGA